MGNCTCEREIEEKGFS